MTGLLEQIRTMSEEFIELIPEEISDEQVQNQYLASLNSIVYSFENSVMNSAILHFDKQQLITFSTSISLSSPSALQEAYNWAITTADYANAMGKVQEWFKRWVKAVVVGLITIVGTAVGIVAAVAIGTVCPACFVPAVVALPTAGFIYGYELGCTIFDGTCP